MINKIYIKDKSDLNEILFPKEIDLSSQVVLLFGGNGVGKSTLIKTILGEKYRGEFKSDITGNSMTMFRYIDSEQNSRELQRNPMVGYNGMFNMHNIANMINAQELSEGQSIIYTVQEFLHLAKEQDIDKESLFVVDEVDSGLSVDNIIWLCDEIKCIAKNNPNIQFVIAFNNYEFCEQFSEVTSMYTGEKLVINSYDQYKKELLKWRKKLLKKRDNNQFRDL